MTDRGIILCPSVCFLYVEDDLSVASGWQIKSFWPFRQTVTNYHTNRDRLTANVFKCVIKVICCGRTKGLLSDVENPQNVVVGLVVIHVGMLVSFHQLHHPDGYRQGNDFVNGFENNL